MTKALIEGLLLLAVWGALAGALVLVAGCSDGPSTTQIVCTDYPVGTAPSTCREETTE